MYTNDVYILPESAVTASLSTPGSLSGTWQFGIHVFSFYWLFSSDHFCPIFCPIDFGKSVLCYSVWLSHACLFQTSHVAAK